MIQLTDEERATLGAARAILDRLLASGCDTDVASRHEQPTEEPKWMRLTDYARARSIGRRSLDRYIANGFPTKGAGHSRRVVVADADAWLERRNA